MQRSHPVVVFSTKWFMLNCFFGVSMYLPANMKTGMLLTPTNGMTHRETSIRTHLKPSKWSISSKQQHVVAETLPLSVLQASVLALH
jgi:hypothetical protein